MRKLVFLIFLILYSKSNAQNNVSISDVNNATPDASSVLDVSSTSKGLLVPRVSLSSMTDGTTILLPATSLLVYNTNASMTNGAGVGYYYNAGTSAAPNWQKILSGNTIGEWKLLGNAGTNATTNFLGTTDAIDLVFRTNNTEKVRVMSGGNVGIGTSAPTYKLDITPATSTGTGIRILDNSSNPGVQLIAIGDDSYLTDLDVANMLGVYGQQASTEGGIQLGSAGGYVYGKSGNIGIGTTAPNASSLLEVSSTSKGVLIPRVALTSISDVSTISSPATSLLVYNTATAGVSPNNVTPGFYYWNGTAWQRFDTGNNVGDWKLLGNAGTVAGTNFIGTTDAIDFVTKTNNTERMRVTSGGNVGIGTSTPGDKLDVLSTGGKNILLGGGATTGSELKFTNSGTAHFSIYNNGNSNLTFASTSSLFQTNTAGTALMSLTSTGNLGIGTTSPSQKLDVVGNVQFSQALMPNANAGTSGQVLISQGANTAPIWNSPYGGNIQYAKGTTDITMNSTTFADMTDMTITFTPKHNVVFLNFSAAGDMVASGAAMAYCSFKIVKDGTDVANAGTGSLTTDYDDYTGTATAWNAHFTMFPINVTVGVQTTIKIQWNRGGLYPTTLRNRVSTNPTYSHRSLMIFD